MLREITKVRQIPGEARRRWFTGADMDLFVWSGDDGEIERMQLCYSIDAEEKALTWSTETGYTHHGVDDGDTPRQMQKQSPLLVPDGLFNNNEVRMRFLAAARDIDSEVSEFVADKLAAYELESPGF